MKYYDWNGYVAKLCAEANDFSHLDDPTYPFERKNNVCSVSEDFYTNLQFPDWYNSDSNAGYVVNQFKERTFKAIKEYFDIVPIIKKKSDKVRFDDNIFEYTIEPGNQFLWQETIAKLTNGIKYSNFHFMFFVNFEIRFPWRHNKVRQFIFDIVSKNQIYPFNITTTLKDEHYKYYNFKPHIFKYRYQKIPVIRKLTGIQKPGDDIIGMELFYKMNLNTSDGKDNIFHLCR